MTSLGHNELTSGDLYVSMNWVMNGSDNGLLHADV